MSQLQEQLKERFGFEAFREGQEDAISRLLEGKSVLAIFPTGGGKSLCYQLPALLLDGLTVVISPLIALMKDQLDFLISKGAPAARLDSTRRHSETKGSGLTIDIMFGSVFRMGRSAALDTKRVSGVTSYVKCKA